MINSGAYISNAAGSSQCGLSFFLLPLLINFGFYSADQAGNGGISKSGNAYAGNGKRSFYYPFPVYQGGNGGNAETGNTGSANGGGVLNEGWFISNGYGASKLYFFSQIPRF